MTISASETASAECGQEKESPRLWSRSVSVLVTRSQPLTRCPISISMSARPDMPDPATPMRWRRAGCSLSIRRLRKVSIMDGCMVRVFNDIGDAGYCIRRIQT